MRGFSDQNLIYDSAEQRVLSSVLEPYADDPTFKRIEQETLTHLIFRTETPDNFTETTTVMAIDEIIQKRPASISTDINFIGISFGYATSNNFDILLYGVHAAIDSDEWFFLDDKISIKIDGVIHDLVGQSDSKMNRSSESLYTSFYGDLTEPQARQIASIDTSTPIRLYTSEGNIDLIIPVELFQLFRDSLSKIIK